MSNNCLQSLQTIHSPVLFFSPVQFVRKYCSQGQLAKIPAARRSHYNSAIRVYRMQLCTQVYVCCKTLNQDFAGCYLTNREFYVFADLVYGIASTDECANLVFAKLKFCRRRMPRIYFTAIFGKMCSLQQQPSGILFFQAFRKIKCS